MMGITCFAFDAARAHSEATATNIGAISYTMLAHRRYISKSFTAIHTEKHYSCHAAMTLLFQRQRHHISHSITRGRYRRAAFFCFTLTEAHSMKLLYRLPLLRSASILRL